ncbi:uncharacterized protein METZ01_LOCUS18050 [marine metagenome]|uniref:DUF885 domain-containing protein n=1 Tax=marine metagenome TaxID=408172 RepID=A0A381PDX1_9ZZZZ
MKKFFILLLLFFIGCTGTKVSEDEIKEANQFFESIFLDQVQESPEFQTRLGYKSNYDQWDDITWEQRRSKIRKGIYNLKYLHDTIDYDKLDEATKISYRLIERRFERQIESNDYIFNSYPITHRGGKHSSIPSFLINYHNIDDEDDVKDYLKRLRNIEPLMDDLIRELKFRDDLNIVAPQFVYPQAIKVSQNIISGYPFEDVKKRNVLFDDFSKKLDKLDLSGPVKTRYLSEAEAILVTIVKSSYQKIIDFLSTQETKATDNFGVWKYKNGAEYYQFQLDGYTTLGLTPEQIHATGLQEVERIHQEIYGIMEATQFEGTLQDFFEFMRTDPQFYYPDNQKGRDAYLNQVNVIMDTLTANIDQLFNGLPSIPFVVKAVEPYREESAGIAFYQRGKADGSRPGIYYANLYTMQDMPTYKLENLAYHEAIPGHHLQISIALETKGMPSFRKYGGYSVYSEGWALYSETLPKEVGLYKDPYSDFGRLSGELWRACRLVVDTGIHHYRWTREEGIEYYRSNTANPEGECVKMVERHIVWPGQAVSYKIGMLKIQELRQYAHTELGEKFSLQDFHDIVLKNGAMTMDILQDVVYQWVENQ